MTEPLATAGPPPRVDVQDPLPESTWLWRRLFVFAVTAVILWMIARYGDRFSDIAAVAVQAGETQVTLRAVGAMLSLIYWLLSGLFIMILFYMVAPSAEQVTRMIQVARTLRDGVSFHGSARASDGRRTAETVSVAGKGAVAAAEPPAVAYDGPPEADIPPAAADTPEEPKWP